MATKLKCSQDQMQEALNRDLSDTVVSVAGYRIPVKAMTLKDEQRFIKEIRKMVPANARSLSIPEIIDALTDADPQALAEIICLVAKSGGLDLDPQTVVNGSRMTEILGAIEAQAEKNGYLDFLLRTAANLNLAARK